MWQRMLKIVDWFIPAQIRESDSDLLMARTFVALHLIGPIMGHAVTYFLANTPAGSTWQFKVTEAMVLSFFFIPLVVRQTASLKLAAMMSTQILIALSLFGSFFFGGISSPFLPWFLIAMVLGFFFLANHVRGMLVGLVVQLSVFAAGRLWMGTFPKLLPEGELAFANFLSISAALAYMTLLALYYEQVMRLSTQVEADTVEQRAKLEKLREAMEQAEIASRRKSIFLAKMSHELRTPLNAVIGYTEILRENCDDGDKDARKIEDLDRIRAAGRHLLELVDNVVDLSSIESKRIELNAEQTDIEALINDVVATATPLINKRGNRLVVNVPNGLGEFLTDALKLRQCLLNLLSNAAKFTTQGTIMLTATRASEGSREWLTFEVGDDGIGMTEEGVGRLFQEFSQAENDTSNRYGGSGLGLALTRRLCEMMGGNITVRSAYGDGSVFTIKIPVNSKKPARVRGRAAA